MRSRMWLIGSMGVLATSLTLSSDFRDAGAHTAQGKSFECNNRTIKGTYGIQMQGTRPIPGGNTNR